jgi:hypothetical protein
VNDGFRHPADRIRARVLFLCVALVLLGKDLWRIRGWAAEARAIERDLRARSAHDLNVREEIADERIAELKAELAEARRRGFAPAEEVDPEPEEAT